MARYPKGSSPKLTKEIIEKITTAMRNGAYVETAVAYCGISKDSFYRWLRMANTDSENGLYRALSYAIERAWAEAEMKDVEAITKAVEGSPDQLAIDENGRVITDAHGYPVVAQYGLPPNWRAAAWRLERKFPDKWGRKTKVEIDSKPDFAESIEIVFVDPQTEN